MILETTYVTPKFSSTKPLAAILPLDANSPSRQNRYILYSQRLVVAFGWAGVACAVRSLFQDNPIPLLSVGICTAGISFYTSHQLRKKNRVALQAKLAMEFKELHRARASKMKRDVPGLDIT